MEEKEKIIEITVYTVYANGYVLYQEGIRATVFPIHNMPENTLKGPEGVEAELLEKVLSNSKMATLLSSFTKQIK